MSESAAPVFPAAVCGYRVWKWNRDPAGGRLHSIGRGGVDWPSQPATASCYHDRSHTPPQELCECGWYALHSLSSALRDRDLYQAMYATGATADAHPDVPEIIVGLVAGSGPVELHRTGWRSERAQVIAILAPAREEDCASARLLARRYGAELAQTPQDLEEVATRLGLACAPESVIAEIPERSAEEIREERLSSQLELAPWRLWSHDRQLALTVWAELATAALPVAIPAALLAAGANPLVATAGAGVGILATAAVLWSAPLARWAARRGLRRSRAS